MQGTSRPKVKRSELASAIRVLNQLKRHIDAEAEDSLTRRGRWFLQSARTTAITREAIWRMEAVEEAIRSLIQWFAGTRATKPVRRAKAQPKQGQRK
jgi:NADH dehydrogenase FAD-containing subunit